MWIEWLALGLNLAEPMTPEAIRKLFCHHVHTLLHRDNVAALRSFEGLLKAIENCEEVFHQGFISELTYLRLFSF